MFSKFVNTMYRLNIIILYIPILLNRSSINLFAVQVLGMCSNDNDTVKNRIKKNFEETLNSIREEQVGT